ncbi:helix-turn-helix domain-containing protein [Corynebacterium propinquum]|uniref:Helix-turn-helix domain-containing protein n=1 Tax=Corynebacterium propinquum TaxID=43769 RepID=A0AAP4F7B2_9CORY|nr:helix-turn-helix domain-containing protein [Corynebacterium propinquum]MDK4326770.1 helix-turn-helix domain-containing protein [Corynebacterium propinquum]
MVDIVVGRRVDAGFSLMPNALARDPKASARAIRVYCFLNSHAEGWKTSAARIAEQINASEKTIKEALRELESLGYLDRVQSRDGSNRFEGTAYVVHQISVKPQVVPVGQNLPDGDSSRGVKTTQREHAGETVQNPRSFPEGKIYPPVRRLSNKTNSRVTGGGDRYGGHRAGDATDPQPENSLESDSGLASGADARSDAPEGADGAAGDSGLGDSDSQPDPNTPQGSQSVSNASNPHAGAITPTAPQKSASGSPSPENGDKILTLDQLAQRQQEARRCDKHAQWPADKPVPSCLACKNVRENYERDVVAFETSYRTMSRAAKAICTECDEAGMIKLPGGYTICDHPTVTRGDVADYLQKQPPKVHSQPAPPKRKLAPMPIEKYPAHAREKACPECGQPAGTPCKFPDGYQPPAPCTARILNLQPVKETQ